MWKGSWDSETQDLVHEREGAEPKLPGCLPKPNYNLNRPSTAGIAQTALTKDNINEEINNTTIQNKTIKPTKAFEFKRPHTADHIGEQSLRPQTNKFGWNCIRKAYPLKKPNQKPITPLNNITVSTADDADAEAGKKLKCLLSSPGGKPEHTQSPWRCLRNMYSSRPSTRKKSTEKTTSVTPNTSKICKKVLLNLIKIRSKKQVTINNLNEFMKYKNMFDEGQETAAPRRLRAARHGALKTKEEVLRDDSPYEQQLRDCNIIKNSTVIIDELEKEFSPIKKKDTETRNEPIIESQPIIKSHQPTEQLITFSSFNKKTFDTNIPKVCFRDQFFIDDNNPSDPPPTPNSSTAAQYKISLPCPQENSYYEPLDFDPIFKNYLSTNLIDLCDIENDMSSEIPRLCLSRYKKMPQWERLLADPSFYASRVVQRILRTSYSVHVITVTGFIRGDYILQFSSDDGGEDVNEFQPQDSILTSATSPTASSLSDSRNIYPVQSPPDPSLSAILTRQERCQLLGNCCKDILKDIESRMPKRDPIVEKMSAKSNVLLLDQKAQFMREIEEKYSHKISTIGTKDAVSAHWETPAERHPRLLSIAKTWKSLILKEIQNITHAEEIVRNSVGHSDVEILVTYPIYLGIFSKIYGCLLPSTANIVGKSFAYFDWVEDLSFFTYNSPRAMKETQYLYLSEFYECLIKCASSWCVSIEETHTLMIHLKSMLTDLNGKKKQCSPDLVTEFCVSEIHQRKPELTYENVLSEYRSSLQRMQDESHATTFAIKPLAYLVASPQITEIDSFNNPKPGIEHDISFHLSEQRRFAESVSSNKDYKIGVIEKSCPISKQHHQIAVCRRRVESHRVSAARRMGRTRRGLKNISVKPQSICYSDTLTQAPVEQQSPSLDIKKSSEDVVTYIGSEGCHNPLEFAKRLRARDGISRLKIRKIPYKKMLRSSHTRDSELLEKLCSGEGSKVLFSGGNVNRNFPSLSDQRKQLELQMQLISDRANTILCDHSIIPEEVDKKLSTKVTPLQRLRGPQTVFW